jgi:hypothetical protein
MPACTEGYILPVAPSRLASLPDGIMRICGVDTAGSCHKRTAAVTVTQVLLVALTSAQSGATLLLVGSIQL